MGTCLSKNKTNDTTKKLTLGIFGLDNAGKTCTTKCLKGEKMDDIAPTCGFNKIDLQFSKHNITIFDLGGGKKFRGIWKHYLAELYGFIYVVDSVDADRMVESKLVFDELLGHERASRKPVLVLANKNDDSMALNEKQVCTRMEIEKIVNNTKSPCRVISCSAMKGIGRKTDPKIAEGMTWLLERIDENEAELVQRIKDDVEEQRAREAEEKRVKLERGRERREKRAKELDTQTNSVENHREESEDEGFQPLNMNTIERIERKEQQRARARARRQKEIGDEADDSNTETPQRRRVTTISTLWVTL